MFKERYLTNSVIHVPSMVDTDESALDFVLFIFSDRNVIRAMLLVASALFALIELLRHCVSSNPSIGSANRAAVSAKGITEDGHWAKYLAANSTRP